VVPNDKGKELEFERLSKEMGAPGTIIVMREMLKRQTVPDVGGHFQIGVAGFRLAQF
jgi:hypothetical protein